MLVLSLHNYSETSQNIRPSKVLCIRIPCITCHKVYLQTKKKGSRKDS